MAKKTKKTDKGKRATTIVVNILANVLVTKAIVKLKGTAFMQPKEGEKAGVNMKQAAVESVLAIGGIALGVMVPGDISLAVGSGIAAAAVNSGIDTVHNGMNGMGATDYYLDLYNGTNGVDEVPLAGSDPIDLV
jgi:hypothetical protein